MGIVLSTIRSSLNVLLPFTNQSTPVVQDLIHTAILFITLYYGPQLVEYFNHHPQPLHPPEPTPTDPLEGDTDDPPIDEYLILQDDSDEEVEPPPLAPTPPPNFPGLAQPPPPADWHAFPDPGPPHVNHDFGEGPDRPRQTPQNRTIGAKKAKSLARKDQRRAYHEFHRQEAEIRRLREAEGRDEREALLAAEKARRTEVEREIQERERLERERKKEEERKEAEEERMRRERVVERVREELRRCGAVDMVALAWEEGKDRLWVERLVRASGILSQNTKTATLTEKTAHIMITSGGWVVRVDSNIMAEAYAAALSYGDGNGGIVSFSELGTILEKTVRAKVAAS